MIDDFLRDLEKNLNEMNKKLDILENEQKTQIEILTTTDIMDILRN